jgi:hypothetical protein
MLRALTSAAIGAAVLAGAAPAQATDAASLFDAPGESHANVCVHLAGSSAPLRFADADPTGFSLTDGLRFDPGQCPDGTVRLDLHELIPSGQGDLVFHRGGNGYLDDKNVKYGELLTSDIAGPLPAPIPSSGGRGAPCTLADESPYQVHVRSIPSQMRYKRPPNTGSSFAHYGDPGSDQGDRQDIHYTYLVWSFLDVRGGGHVRILLRPDQIVRACDVQPVTMTAWDAAGNVNGHVTARYVRALAGSCPLYGWMVWSHKYLDHATAAHALPAAGPPPPDPEPDPRCPVAAAASPPQVTTEAAQPVQGGAWTLAATVNPVGVPATYHFEYGVDPAAYAARTADNTVGPADRFLPVAAPVTGLQPSTTYHYRVVASSLHGTTPGPDGIFTTGAQPPLATASPRSFVLSRLRVAPAAFLRARSAGVSTAHIRYVLSRRARVMLTFQRRKVGVRRADGCRPAPRGRLPHGTPRCALWVTLRGSLHQSAGAGRRSVRFGGWLGRRPLGHGRYRVRAVAVGSDGRRGVARRAGFSVRR